MKLAKLHIFGKVSLFLLAFTLVGITFLLWEEYRITLQNRQLETDIRKITNEIKYLGRTQDLAKTKTALENYRKAVDYRVPWSAVVGEIFRLETPKTKFISFSSGMEKKINITGKTTSWEDVSLLLERLKATPRISEPFISSVSERIVDSGNFDYQFTLTFNFASL